MAHETESTIIINGVELTHAQSMTIRVALGAFATDLNEQGLGDDKVGQKICENYLLNIHEIYHLMFKDTKW